MAKSTKKILKGKEKFSKQKKNFHDDIKSLKQQNKRNILKAKQILATKHNENS